MQSDFVMIVANLCKVQIEEVVVASGSELDKKLTAEPSFGTYPILELDANTRISDSVAIATYIA
jgi:glutathione S-transferase